MRDPDTQKPSTPLARRWLGGRDVVHSAALAALIIGGILAWGAAVFIAPMEPRGRSLVWNTLSLASAVAAASTLLGGLLAVALAKTRLPMRAIVAVFLAWAALTPLYLQAGAWMAGFGLGGWYALATGGAAWLTGWFGAFWIHTLAAVPWTAGIIAAGLWSVERELEESAVLDAGAPRVIWHVSLRRCVASIAAAALLAAVVAGGEISVTDLFMVRTYAEELYTEIAIGRDVGQAPLSAAVGMAITAVLVLACGAACRMAVPNTSTAGRAPWLADPRRWRWPLAAAMCLATLAIVAIPWINLISKAGIVVTDVSGARVRSWSALKCAAVVLESPLRYAEEIGWSLAIGVLAATAASAWAACLAWWARTSTIGQIAAWFTVSLALAIPGPVLGVAITSLLNRPDVPLFTWLLDQSILAPWLAQTVKALPLATIVLWLAFRSLPQEMLDMAAVDGAGRWTQLWSIALPQRRAAAALAWIAALAASLAELGATILVSPPGVTTLSVRISTLLHYGVEDYVAGIILAQGLGFLCVACVAAWLVRQAFQGEFGDDTAPPSTL